MNRNILIVSAFYIIVGVSSELSLSGAEGFNHVAIDVKRRSADDQSTSVGNREKRTTETKTGRCYVTRIDLNDAVVNIMTRDDSYLIKAQIIRDSKKGNITTMELNLMPLFGKDVYNDCRLNDALVKLKEEIASGKQIEAEYVDCNGFKQEIQT
ncbi:uncharacterized protein LOC141910482 [Tubulanus polymorphus]|uniref:uncharacterized protein LOC141910482 n=1 Tax=Tubulanus polymorphus TaxID=672921 RepID=UPI003DA4B4E9